MSLIIFPSEEITATTHSAQTLLECNSINIIEKCDIIFIIYWLCDLGQVVNLCFSLTNNNKNFDDFDTR